jgi:hypothetical protein
MHKASTVLTRATMAIDHPIFDPNANRKNRNVFLAHIFIIETAKLRVACTWIFEHLDTDQRRRIIVYGIGLPKRITRPWQPVVDSVRFLTGHQ